jgi:hypothetical protein
VNPNRKYICASATLSTTNPTWHDPGSNPNRRGGIRASSHLSYGTALERIQVIGFKNVLGNEKIRTVIVNVTADTSLKRVNV